MADENMLLVHQEGEYTFSGVPHRIIVKALSGANAGLGIEVVNKSSGEAWQGKFDPTFVENMTKKTGNYKAYGVFVNMLKSAVAKSTDSVWLDLLSISDLERLRASKAKSNGDSAPTNIAKNSAVQPTKRYLILMYNVEFDRIHFPLPLNLVELPCEPPASVSGGNTNSNNLRNLVADLRDDVSRLKTQLASDYRIVGYDELLRNYDRVVEDKRSLEEACRRLQEEVYTMSHDGSAKQIRVLKNVIRQLEQEIMQMKSQNQHAISRKEKDLRLLNVELEEVRSSERQLKARIRSLCDELQNYRNRNGSRLNYSSGSGRLVAASTRPSPRQVGMAMTARSPAGNNGILNLRQASRSRSRDSARSSTSPTRGRPVVSRPIGGGGVKPVRPSPNFKSLQQPPRARISSRSPSPGYNNNNGRPSRQRVVNVNVSGGSNLSNHGFFARTPSISSIASAGSDDYDSGGNNNSIVRHPPAALRRGRVYKAAPLKPSQIINNGKSGSSSKSKMVDFEKSSFLLDELEAAVADAAAEKPLEGGNTNNNGAPMLFDRASEMMEIDARLRRLQSLLKDSN